MPAIMRILGWRAEGLRCPDHEISCADSEDVPYPVSLIQMPNGTGKTTTLNLLRAALSGSGDWGLEPNAISSYRKRNSDRSDGVFEVRLLLNSKRATITMEFDFESGRVSYKTTHGSGRSNGFYPPPDFRRFMNKNFVRFYVFDGELAQQLLDRDNTNAEAVVQHLFQMNTFDDMEEKVREYWDSKVNDASATEERGLSRRRNRLKSLEKRLKKLELEQEELCKKRVQLGEQLRAKEDAYKQEIDKEKERSQTLRNAEKKFESLKGKVREEALEVLDRMRDPHALSEYFANSMLALKDGLDKVKLPESAAREFFEDLAEEAECVCGRSIDTETAETIRTRATQYLGSEDVSLLNSMKTAIKEVVGDKPDESQKDLNTQMISLSSVVDEERDARNDLDALKLEAGQLDPAVKSAQEEIDRLNSEIRDVDEELEKFESKDQALNDERTYGIEIIKKRIKDAEQRVAEITQTLTEKEKRNILTNIISNAHQKARDGITTKLCDQTNERIVELMPSNNISINRIERNLILKGQHGGSTGEQLSIAYAFLATLFHGSDHQLPFVVDSPAGPIDLAVRPKIGELIPNLSGQFIAFTISSERPSFTTALKRGSNSQVQFVTLFRKGFKELEHAAHQKGNVLESNDGLIVEGEDFFNEFQLDDEEIM